MTESDRAKWNAKYGEKGADPPDTPPHPFLLELDPMLPGSGRALDVAGGAGRNAIWLARRGLDVTLADISDVARVLAGARAAELGVALRTLAVDLDSDPLPTGPWDLVVSFNYLWRLLFQWSARHLANGGVFVYVQPTMRNLERNAHPSARYLLADGELPSLLDPCLEILRYREGWFDGRHEARLCARRRPRGASPG